MMFKKDLIDLILTGKKTMTSRDKKLYEVGEVTNLMANKDYSKISGKYIKIVKVYQKALGKFSDIDAQKEGFEQLKKEQGEMEKTRRDIIEYRRRIREAKSQK